MNIPSEDIEQYAPKLSLIKHTGMLFAWQQLSTTVRGDIPFVWPYVKKAQLHNLFFGWWSPMSVLINPIVILINFVSYARYKRKWQEFAADPKNYIYQAKSKESLKRKR